MTGRWVRRLSHGNGKNFEERSANCLGDWEKKLLVCLAQGATSALAKRASPTSVADRQRVRKEVGKPCFALLGLSEKRLQGGGGLPYLSPSFLLPWPSLWSCALLDFRF